jgi:hypothetical protein
MEERHGAERAGLVGEEDVQSRTEVATVVVRDRIGGCRHRKSVNERNRCVVERMGGMTRADVDGVDVRAAESELRLGDELAEWPGAGAGKRGCVEGLGVSGVKQHAIWVLWRWRLHQTSGASGPAGISCCCSQRADELCKMLDIGAVHCGHDGIDVGSGRPLRKGDGPDGAGETRGIGEGDGRVSWDADEAERVVSNAFVAEVGTNRLGEIDWAIGRCLDEEKRQCAVLAYALEEERKGSDRLRLRVQELQVFGQGAWLDCDGQGIVGWGVSGKKKVEKL